MAQRKGSVGMCPASKLTQSSELERTPVAISEHYDNSILGHYIIIGLTCPLCVFLLKSKMLELFSNRLDVLHSHQASSESARGHKYAFSSLTSV